MYKLVWQTLVLVLFVSDNWKHSRQVVQQIYLLVIFDRDVVNCQKCLYFPKHHQMENKYLTTVSKSLYFPKHHHMENNCFETEKINRKINKKRITLANYSATSDDCLEFFCFVQNKYRKVYNFQDTIKGK